MPSFDRKSNYDKDSGIVEVQIGMEKPVLEVELNELQEIARERVKKVVDSVISDGAFSDTGISYSGGKVKVVNTAFIIGGELIFVDNLELPASNNDEVFIKVWDKQVTGEDILKKYGNEQGEVITNKIIDERVGKETSRRIVLAYDLVKSLEQNEKGLKLGKIVNGNLVLEVKIILSLNGVKDLLAGKVDNNRVLTDVPENAKFTDTTYSEISTSEIDAGTSSTLRTISGRRVKYILDKVQGWIGNLTKADVGLDNVDNVKQATKVEFDEHLADDVQHITAAERTAWDAKISASLLTTKGDILYHNGTGLARLPRGTTGQILKVKSDGSLEWGELDVIQPTKPIVINFAQESPVMETWYTVLDVTSGKGILSKISVAALTGSNGPLINTITVKVTIDGNIYTYPLAGTDARQVYSSSSREVRELTFFSYFKSSMKIELSHTDPGTSGGRRLFAAVDCSLE